MTAVLDRREELNDELWQQGFLIMTRTTRKWNKEQRDKIDYIERCTAFAHFRTRDEGRSRQYVYRFNTPEECAAAVHAHNKERKAAWTAEQANKL